MAFLHVKVGDPLAFHHIQAEWGRRGGNPLAVLLRPFLNALRKERVPVSIYLVNGIKLQGQIESFDQFVVLLRNNVSQMVYKHAISTVVPSRNVKFTAQGQDAEEDADATE